MKYTLLDNFTCVTLVITCTCTRLHKLEHYVFLAHYASSFMNCKEVLNIALGNIKNTWFGLNIVKMEYTKGSGTRSANLKCPLLGVNYLWSPTSGKPQPTVQKKWKFGYPLFL